MCFVCTLLDPNSAVTPRLTLQLHCKVVDAFLTFSAEQNHCSDCSFVQKQRSLMNIPYSLLEPEHSVALRFFVVTQAHLRAFRRRLLIVLQSIVLFRFIHIPSFTLHEIGKAALARSQFLYRSSKGASLRICRSCSVFSLRPSFHWAIS